MCLFIAACVALFAASTFAQSGDTINRVEGFVGYSYNNIDSGINGDDIDPEFSDSVGSRVGTHGFNGSVTGNFNKYVGAKFDYSFNKKSEDFEFDGDNFTADYRLHQFLGGLQFKNNLKDGPRFKPFGHILAGVARQSIGLKGPGIDTEFGTSEVKVGTTDFAMVFGGGVDVKVHKNIDIRIFQVDYNPIFVRDRTIDGVDFNGTTQNNFRFSFGVVFH
jgi:hypothetical protein